MGSHIEWASARHVQVTGIAEPGEFENDGTENEVGCITITDEDGNGMCIEGPPDDLAAFAYRILNAANGVKSDTNHSPRLRSLYGDTSPEPSLLHEEMERQRLDDIYSEPEYDDGSGR